MKLTSLPKSLRRIRESVQASSNGQPFSMFGIKPTKWTEAQGTRAGAWQGTASAGNTPDPLRPGRTNTPDRPLGWDAENEMQPEMQFSTYAPAYDGSEGTLTTERGWPPNPSRESLSPSVGHHEQNLMNDLNMGPGPGRIARLMPTRVFGRMEASSGIAIGLAASLDGNTASHDYLRHQDIARQALGIKGPQKVSDDNAVIPAIYAGNPRV